MSCGLLCVFSQNHDCFVCVKLLQSSLTLCEPLDRGPPGSSVRGILQARILEQVAISSSRRSWPRDQTLGARKWTINNSWTHPKEKNTKDVENPWNGQEFVNTKHLYLLELISFWNFKKGYSVFVVEYFFAKLFFFSFSFPHVSNSLSLGCQVYWKRRSVI